MRSGLPLGEAAAAPLRRVEAPRNASSRARAAKMSSLSSRMPPLPPAPAYDPSTTPAYDLLSADIGYTLRTTAGEVTLYARGRNLLDETRRDATSFLKDVAPRPGRSLYLGLRFDFSGTTL